MPRPITLCTGQWADLPLRVLAEKAASWGYDGLELACWGDHMDVFQAAESLEYCEQQKAILAEHGLALHAISNHLPGQLTLDPNTDSRSDAWAPKDCAGDPEKKRAYGVEAMKKTAHAAKNLGLEVVNGFSGSPIWHLLYSFPPVSEETIQSAFDLFAEVWNPILDVYDECGVLFAYEVHPTEIAFDLVTARRMLEAVKGRKVLGFNFDPSHLYWQSVDPALFLKELSDRIYHCHMKDAALQLDGRSGILGSHYNFGHPRRGWDFRSLGHGDVDFEEIVRTLNAIGYAGPLSVEWEDSGMEREHGARESCQFLRELDFQPSGRAFDSAFGDDG